VAAGAAQPAIPAGADQTVAAATAPAAGTSILAKPAGPAVPAVATLGAISVHATRAAGPCGLEEATGSTEATVAAVAARGLAAVKSRCARG
ncbi:hypothetical protein OSI25_25415, partial [Mycobacterium ulcerans]